MESLRQGILEEIFQSNWNIALSEYQKAGSTAFGMFMT